MEIYMCRCLRGPAFFAAGTVLLATFEKARGNQTAVLSLEGAGGV